jgi:hypothetical protein
MHALHCCEAPTHLPGRMGPTRLDFHFVAPSLPASPTMSHNTSAASGMTNAYLHDQHNLYDRLRAQNRSHSAPVAHGPHNNTPSQTVDGLDHLMESMTNPALLQQARLEQQGMEGLWSFHLSLLVPY